MKRLWFYGPHVLGLAVAVLIFLAVALILVLAILPQEAVPAAPTEQAPSATPAPLPSSTPAPTRALSNNHAPAVFNCDAYALGHECARSHVLSDRHDYSLSRHNCAFSLSRARALSNGYVHARDGRAASAGDPHRGAGVAEARRTDRLASSAATVLELQRAGGRSGRLDSARRHVPVAR